MNQKQPITSKDWFSIRVLILQVYCVLTSWNEEKQIIFSFLKLKNGKTIYSPMSPPSLLVTKMLNIERLITTSKIAIWIFN